MKEKVPQKARILMASVGDLIRGRIHKLLFPVERDWRELREEIEKNGFRLEHAVVVRPHQKGKGFEIIDGLGRATVAEERGLARIPALVLEAGDEEALRYAAEANLYAGRARKRLSLPQAITLAKAHEEAGGEYRVAPIIAACGVSEPTYKRAHSSLIFAVEKLRRDHPELADVSLAEVVSESVRRKLWGDFTDFFTGMLPANTFYEKHYLKSERAEGERRKQVTYGSRAALKAGRRARSEALAANEAAHGKGIAPLRSVPPTHLRILELSASAPPLSTQDLGEVERHLRGQSDKELDRIVNCVRTLSALAGRTFDARQAARRRAAQRGKTQGVLPYQASSGNVEASADGEVPKSRGTRRARKSSSTLVSSAVHRF